MRYDAVLAGLRAGALREADAMIESFGFSGANGESEAALAASAPKEKA